MLWGGDEVWGGGNRSKPASPPPPKGPRENHGVGPTPATPPRPHALPADSRPPHSPQPAAEHHLADAAGVEAGDETALLEADRQVPCLRSGFVGGRGAEQHVCAANPRAIGRERDQRPADAL